MTDLTNNKIRPFFHIKNFKDGVEDAVFLKKMILKGRSSEYREGYDFGIFLIENRSIGLGPDNQLSPKSGL